MRLHFPSSRRVGRGWYKLFAGGIFAGLAVLAICWGRNNSLPRAEAQPSAVPPPVQAPAPPGPLPSSDYADRVVAYIYGNIPITREDLGEYLIARYGVERLELLINKRIIEHACQQHGVRVDASEVDAALAEDLKGLGGITTKEFVAKLLKPYNKTLYEWKEDVIRPKLALGKLIRNQVKPEPQDFEMAFEAYYGEKVECRIILWPKPEKEIAFREYDKIRDSEEEFDRKARSQASSQLAALGGKVSPIGRFTTGNPELEKEAFSLRPGEISRILETPEGYVVLKCDKRIPGDSKVTLDQVRAQLEKEIIDKKIQAEIPRFFEKLRAEAQPKPLLKKNTPDLEIPPTAGNSPNQQPGNPQFAPKGN